MENTHTHPKILKFKANMEFPDRAGGRGFEPNPAVRVWIHLLPEHTLG